MLTITRPCAAVAALLAAVLATACAPRTAAPPPGPVVMQRCPDASDGSTIVTEALMDAHRALSDDPAAPLLPPCVLDAVADIGTRLPDSLRAQAVVQTDEALRRAPDDPAALAVRVRLLTVAGQHADAVRAYERLFAVDSAKATTPVSRAAIASAYAVRDTAALMRAMNRSAADPEIGQAIAFELNVLRQSARLWTSVNDAKATVRRYPSVTNLFPSLVANLGTLGLPDSVAVFLRMGMQRGVSRDALAPSLESLAAAMSRRSVLYGAVEGWELPLAGAFRVDSVLPTPATRFLVAALVARGAAAEVTEIADLVTDSQTEGSVAAGCARIPRIVTLLDAADERLRLGGRGYAASNGASLESSLAAARARIEELDERCGT